MTDYIVIDTETTDKNPQTSELLQVSIIDSDGNVLFDSYFRPESSFWPEAMKVNHITSEMVKNAPKVGDTACARLQAVKGITRICLLRITSGQGILSAGY